MMRKTLWLVLMTTLLVFLANCVVRSGPHRTVYRESRSCPPAHHWEGGACVHNGHGKHKKWKH
jgi:hypothetical protein